MLAIVQETNLYCVIGVTFGVSAEPNYSLASQKVYCLSYIYLIWHVCCLFIPKTKLTASPALLIHCNLSNTLWSGRDVTRWPNLIGRSEFSLFRLASACRGKIKIKRLNQERGRCSVCVSNHKNRVLIDLKVQCDTHKDFMFGYKVRIGC